MHLPLLQLLPILLTAHLTSAVPAEAAASSVCQRGYVFAGNGQLFDLQCHYGLSEDSSPAPYQTAPVSGFRDCVNLCGRADKGGFPPTCACFTFDRGSMQCNLYANCGPSTPMPGMTVGTWDWA